MKAVDKTILRLEEFVRIGELTSVRAELSQIFPARLPRSSRLPLARICRRANMISLGLRVLGPVVRRPDNRNWQAGATPAELSEYSVLLCRSGALKEAMALLRQVDERQAPEALLYKAYCQMSVWDYESAQRELENYVKLETRPYFQFVGNVNRAAALVAMSKREEALDLLAENIATASQAHHTRLYINSLEMRAQCFIQARDWERAQADLNLASSLTKSDRYLDQVWVKKWRSVLEGLRSRSVEPLKAFKRIALETGQWESLREMDRFHLQVQFEDTIFQRLMFGTPFPHYRRMIQSEHPGAPLPQTYLHGDVHAQGLDIRGGQWLTNMGKEAPTRKIHQVLDALLKDFYKPVAIGGLFSDLFPDEVFDYNSSAHRVSQLLYRTRKWARDNQVPMDITEEGGCYKLVLTGPVGFLVPYQRGLLQTDRLRIGMLAAEFGERLFSTGEGRKVLKVSLATFKLLINRALQEGLAERKGGGAKTRYAIKSSDSSKAA